MQTMDFIFFSLNVQFIALGEEGSFNKRAGQKW